MREWYRTILGLFCVLVCMGCSSSSGGSGSHVATPLTIASIAPANAVVDVPLDTVLNVTCSQDINPSSTIMTLTRNGLSVDGDVTVSGRTITFVPASTLTPGTTYTATISSGMQDLSGNVLEEDYSWSFTSAGSGDSGSHVATPLTISSVAPANAVVDVPLDTVLNVTCSQNIKSSTTIMTLTRNGLNVDGHVTISGSTITFVPASTLAPGTTYTATISSGMQDLSGNVLEEDYSWLFTTEGSGGSGSHVATPLTISSVAPANASVDVPLDTVLNVTCSGDINSSSAIMTLTGNGLRVNGDMTISGSTITFVPASTLAPDTTYTATINSGMRDLSGNVLEEDYSWSFTTGSIAKLENDPENAYAPQIAMNVSGFIVAVWEQTDGLTNSIYANQYVPGIGWTQAQLIETLSGDAHSPQVAIDANGNAIAVWYQYDGTAYSIYTNRYMPGIGWGSALLIEAGTGNAFNPQLAVDANGNAMAVWYQYAGGYYSIYANRYVIGVGWGAAALIENINGYAADPQVVMDRNGNAIAVWRQHDGTVNSIYTNRYVLGTGWSAAGTLLEATNGSADRPQVAIDDNGNAIAVWEQYDGVANSIFANRYVNGVGWGSALALEAGAGPARTPQVIMEANGTAFAVWAQSDGTTWSIYTNRYVTGSGWGTAALIETGTGQASNPQVSVDAFGNAVVTWEQEESGISSINANWYTNGSGWDTARLIESLIGYAYDPQVVMDTYGDAWSIWRNEDSPGSGNYSIFASILR
jgi:hypothetical protein